MNCKSIISRIRMVHVAWWALWLFSMALVGLTVLNHAGLDHAINFRETADTLRYPWGLIPIDILFLRDLREIAGFMALFSLGFVCIAVMWPAKGAYFMALAVGVILLFFSMCTAVFILLSGRLMHSAVRGQSVPTAPAQA